MEEDIKILEKKLKQWEPYKNIKFPTPIEREISKENRAIENLINKYKELLEKVNYLEKIRANQHDEIEDKEAIIKLMAKDIAENKLDEDICRKVRSPEKEECDCYADMYDACYGCVIEYYEKKAKGE